jgi:hypothetical protein
MKNGILTVLLCCLLHFTIDAQSRPVLVSVNKTGTATGNNDSGDTNRYSISANGRYVVFNSEANDITANDNNSNYDVFRRDLVTKETKLVSVNLLGTTSSNTFSLGFAVSPDGRYVGFISSARDLTNLPDNNSTTDVFIRDMVTEETKLVSVNTTGTSASGGIGVYSITPNGRYVLFESSGRDLTSIPRGASLSSDVYVRDLQGGVTTLVSVNSAGTASGNNTSQPHAISDDGRFVTFESLASNLVPSGDNNSNYDIFVRDLLTNTTSLVSVSTDRTNSANGMSRYSILTPDGRYVVFASTATNLVNIPDSNNAYDVFRRDMQTGTTALISINAAGSASGNRESLGLGITYDISADGNLIAFESTASNLITNDLNGFGNDIYLRNVVLNTTTLISKNRDETGSGNSQSYNPRISDDGRYVAFESLANNLVFVPDITGGGSSDVFIRDTYYNQTSLLSYNKTGTATGNNSSFRPKITADGRTAVFGSNATDLTEINDANGYLSDVFVSTLPMPTAASVSVAGRVMGGKRGIVNAIVQLTSQTGELRAVRTNSFGYYRFEDVSAGQSYTLNVFSKRFVFSPRVVIVNQEMSELNFIAEP